jgi:predicted permease
MIPQDVKYGWRTMRQNSGFTAIVILTLGLGIGVNTAMFSLFNDVVLRPLPFHEPQQLVRVSENYGHPETFGLQASYPDFLDWRRWNRSFSGIAAYDGYSAILKADEPEPLTGVSGSANLLEVLGAEPILGRRFFPEEDHPAASGGADAIIISYRLWQKRFNGSRDVLGKTLVLDGTQYSIVGVMPAGFDSRSNVEHPDFWITAAGWERKGSGSRKAMIEERDIYFLNAVGRLQAGISLDQAKADMERVGSLVTQARTDGTKHGVSLRDLQTTLVGDGRKTLLMLLGVTGLVFLIACADVGGLVLARATRRQKEITIRAAIGASKGRIARQLLVESLMLAGAGCAAGIWFATTTSGLLRKLLGLDDTGAVAFDWRVLGFSLIATVLSAIVFGFAPLLDSSRLDLAKGLREATLAATESARQRRLHNVMVTAQLTLAMVLLSGTSLMALSLWRLQHIDAGFEPRNVLTFPVRLPSDRFPTPVSRAPYIADLVARLKSVPGVERASAAGALPMQGDFSRTSLQNVGGQEIEVIRRTGIVFSAVTPDYFRTLHIPLRGGREFTDQDRAGTQPVVIFNEAAVRRYFPGKDAVGQMVTPTLWGGAGSPTISRMVVGVVSDVKLANLAERTAPMIYWPMAQVPSHPVMWATVRTAGEPLSIVSAVRARLHEFDKDLPLYDVQPLSFYYDERLSRPRSTAGLVASFSLLALLLTSIGLYGVIAYSVARRTREIGIRMALGARNGDVLGRFLRSGLTMGIAGAVIGIPVAIAVERLLKSQLYGITKLEWGPIAAGGMLLVVVATLASYFPARRATKVDPLTALRAD